MNRSNESETPTSTGGLTRLLRLAAFGVFGGSLAGAVLALGYGLFRTPPDEEVEPVAVVPAAPTVPEAIDLPAEREPADQLRDAQAEVEALEAQLLAREGQLESVARAAGVPPERVASTDLAAEVEGIRQNLFAARKVRDRLKADLKEALA